MGYFPDKGGRPKGAKNKKTLLMEERRAMFDTEVSQVWLKTIRKMRPEYVGDQFMGKAPDNVNVFVDFDVEKVKELLHKSYGK